MAGERYVQQHQKGQHKTRMHIYSLGDMLMTTIKTTSKQGNHWLSKCLGWSWWRSCRFFSQFVFVLHYDCLRTVFTMVVSPAAQNSRAQGSPGLHCKMMQHPACWKKGSAIKMEPRILVFRRSTRYYNLVSAVDWWSNFCHATCGGRAHVSFTFVVDHIMFWDVARSLILGGIPRPLYIKSRRARTTDSKSIALFYQNRSFFTCPM